MTLNELREQIAIELDAMALIVGELTSLEQDVLNREPSIREKTAGAAFLLNSIMELKIYSNVLASSME